MEHVLQQILILTPLLSLRSHLYGLEVNVFLIQLVIVFLYLVCPQMYCKCLYDSPP